MKTLRLYQAILVVSLLGFCYSAFADDGSGTAVAGVSVATLLALVACQAVAYAIRRVAPSEHFFHTTLGSVAIAAITLVLGAIEPVLETKGFNRGALELAALNALLSFFTTSNPSISVDNVSKKPDPPGTITGVIPSLMFLAMLSAFMALPGCKTTAGQAAGAATTACELGQLPQAEQAAIADATAIAAAGGSNWQQELEALGATLAPGQLSCLLQAIVAAWTAPKGELTADRQTTLSRIEIYLKAHPAPSACVPPPLRACITLVSPRA